MSEERALRAEQEVGRINAFFPLLPQLGNRWAASRPWEGRTVALNLHLTPLTAGLVRELTLGGGQFVVSAANTGTTDAAAVDLIRSFGVDVYTGGDGRDRYLQVLDHKPDYILDSGYDLFSRLLDARPAQARKLTGGVEGSRFGIRRMRERAEPPPFPLFNTSDGMLKDAVENRHGVGEGIWQAVSLLTGMHLSGRRVTVIGYGPVGRGLAAYGRAAGLLVEVVEADPIRRLFAHYDGYPTPKLEDALSRTGIVVTATGRKDALMAEHIEKFARDGLVVLNAGHGSSEIDLPGIHRAAVRKDNIAEQVVRYRFESGIRVTILGDGNPLNIALNAGSPEPVLLQFAVLGLALEWLAREARPAGEHVVPDEIERLAAQLALDALG